MIRDVGRALDPLLEPGEAVFDFSNTPGLFHYFLDRPASNRYYHISIAIRERTQTDLIRSLDAARPRLSCMRLQAWGSPSVWDEVANQVRHYDVSEYLLDHYVPVLESRTFILMRRREDGARAGGSSTSERRRATGAELPQPCACAGRQSDGRPFPRTRPCSPHPRLGR